MPFAADCMQRINTARAQSRDSQSDIQNTEIDIYERQASYDSATQQIEPDTQMPPAELNPLFIEQAATDTTLIARGLTPLHNIPDGAREAFLETGERYGQLIATKSHLAEYEKIELAELSSRSRQQVVSCISKEFASWFPVLHSATINSVKVQNWINHYYLFPQPPARSTLSRYKRNAHSYFRWLTSLGYTDLPDPFTSTKLRRSSSKSQATQREAFTEQQLCELYDAIEDDTLMSVFLIACFSGMRIEEICQIKKEDIAHIEYQGEDHFYFNIHNSKTDAGRRPVPIHKAIEPTVLSLIDSSGSDHLIEDGSSTENNERSSKIGKRFGRLKSRLGYGPTLVFHSIRRSWITQQASNGIEEIVSADIVGHVIPTMTYGHYKDPSTIETRIEAMKKFSYPDLEQLITCP